MVILVPVDGETIQTSYGRRDPLYDMVDEMAEERRRLAGSGSRSRNTSRTGSVRAAPSVDMEADGGFGLKKLRGSRTGVMVGRDAGRMNSEADERQLYAEYLRSSSSTGSQEGGTPRKRKESFAAVT